MVLPEGRNAKRHVLANEMKISPRQFDRYVAKCKNLVKLIEKIESTKILFLSDLAGDGGGSMLRDLKMSVIERAVDLLNQYERNGIKSPDGTTYEWEPGQCAMFKRY